MKDEELVKKLPVFFRTVRGAELTEKQLDDLIEKVLDLIGGYQLSLIVELSPSGTAFKIVVS